MTQKDTFKRLSIEIDEETHRQIKRFALEKNVTVKKWVLNACTMQIKKDSKVLEIPKDL